MADFSSVRTGSSPVVRLLHILLNSLMLGRIVTGLFVVLGGFALTYFSANLTEMFGSISRAEEHL